ncbi:ABC transporter substrate-binding protein [Rhizobium sp. RMa-01]|uniref:ABC transporter substrate-binding protein n=1 Tax=unclassified Rhizobium TaxID=2613769 RepID=UPI0008D91A82|nr:MULTISPECIES: ABC transporter substrate-binding protein [unclassified Rhizobium]OHV23159.1 ABC transporter substrate-binding protein [Rhizobium sp. RSm-3]RVU06651.1 ABC transporter substrate-binding protein [Rhizobium sp. RMa-01]
MKKFASGLSALGVAIAVAGPIHAAEISFAANTTGKNVEFLNKQLGIFEKETGNQVKLVTMPSSSSEQFSQYRLWLAAGNKDIDVYQTDVIWAPQLADQFIDLKEATKDVAGQFFPSIIASQTVNGRLVALPLFTDAPALFYRKDLLEKYGKQPPKTWDEMAATAKEVQDKERQAGQKDLWGYVFQGNSYEGLTCNALEWVKSSGGGQIVEPDGTISINNGKAAAALERAKGWIGTISPPGVLAYQEEESRGVWQTGNAVFMRNWPYAYSLGNGADSAVKGKFDVMTLPVAAAGDKPSSTLGGWNLAVSKYSEKQEAAIALVKFLASKDVQKARAIELSNLPTLSDLYDDKDVAAAQPFMPNWKPIFQDAVPRPSATAKVKYNEVSSKFWTAVHNTLSGSGSAAENLELLEADLTTLKGDAW